MEEPGLPGVMAFAACEQKAVCPELAECTGLHRGTKRMQEMGGQPDSGWFLRKVSHLWAHAPGGHEQKSE